MKHFAFAIVVSLGVGLAAAHAQDRPYAGQHKQELKALSVEEVKQTLSGAGMGYAKAAELNRYPGPMHVLELADKLALTSEQRVRTKALMDAHKVEARAIGAKRIDAERALDALFAGGKVEEAALGRAVRAAAALEGEYRLAHLETHRRMRALLTEDQVSRYEHLRGYAAGATRRHGAKH